MKYYLCLTLLLYLINIPAIFSQTTVEKNGEKWELMVDGEPFKIKGTTFGFDKYYNNYNRFFEDLKYLGVNTIRTWATGKTTIHLLEAAKRHNIKVMLGIWMRHGRPGMEDDDRFDYLTDKAGMEAMYTNAINTVETYKDHPAVLTWGIGNEVYLNMATDEEKLAYSKLLERICAQIKTLDQNHPITSVEAWTFGLDWWEKHVPSLDIYGLNSYGRGAGFLQGELDKRAIDKPYIITEFGPTGEWDMPKDHNGVTIEPTDQEKYNAIVEGYRELIQPKRSCLGVYVFHYNSGDRFGDVWLNTHVNNQTRPQYWAIREAYTDQKPFNKLPIVTTFKLPEGTFESDTWVPVDLKVSDPDGDALQISFHYNHRVGSRRYRNQILPLEFKGDLNNGFQIKLPKVDGAIKVYVYAKDDHKELRASNLAIATNSIKVSDDEARSVTYKVPKVTLPFYVYKDNDDLPYFASGYMGNYKAMTVNLNETNKVHSGTSAIKITYTAKGDWYGLAFMDPANDWGDILGGYNISGAKTFSFWAKSEFSGFHLSVGFGLIDTDKTYPDTAKLKKDIVLTSEWKKYSIKIKKADLSCIRTGLVLFANGRGFSQTIYIDDVVFE